MVTYKIFRSLALNEVVEVKKTKKLSVVKDYLIMMSGCSTVDINEYEGNENWWFGDYLVEVE